MRRFILSLLRRLDAAAGGGIRIWEFGYHSLPRGYAWQFLRGGILAHPVKTLRGLRRYRRFVLSRADKTADGAVSIAVPDEAAFWRGVLSQEKRPLLGLGFCLKPFEPADRSASCPSGRANHECLFLERGDRTRACGDCAIYRLGSRCLAAGCPVYIMTSALDIARDFMFPQIRRRAFPSAILLLCPYSVQAIVLPLFICGVDSLLMEYATGSCADYEQWLRADRGFKEGRTTLSPGSETQLLDWLGKLGAKEWKDGRGKKGRRFIRAGNIFYPD